MELWIDLLRFFHVLAVVFMAWPLYALMVVNERARLGPPLGDRADRYMEDIIRPMTTRCLVFQVTVLISGIALVGVRGLGWSALLTNAILSVKLVLLAALLGLLGYVHLVLQPALDVLFASHPDQPISGDLAGKIGRLRLRRKRIAATCLTLVMTLVLLGLQVYSRFPPTLTAGLMVVIVVFVLRAFRTRILRGWV